MAHATGVVQMNHYLNDINTFINQNQFLSGGLTLGIVGSLLLFLKTLPRKLWDQFLRSFTISVDVVNTDQSFRYTLQWLNTQPYVLKARRLSLRAIYSKPSLVPARGHHLFVWRGRLVWLNWADEEGKMGNSIEQYLTVSREKITIKILGRDRKIAAAFLEEIKALLTTNEDGLIRVYSWNTNNWSYTLKHPRSLATVFLPEAAKGLTQDMRTFLSKTSWYSSLGIPYRRGYLFYGPPGSGKTSCAFALACQFNLSVYVLNLATIGTDQGLQAAIQSIDTKGGPVALLIEDIDTIGISRNYDKTKAVVSLGTVLNSLDGITAQENIFVFITTNHKENLDAALLRPGRIDLSIEFPHATEAQIKQATSLYGRPDMHDQLIAANSRSPMSMAQVQELLRK